MYLLAQAIILSYNIISTFSQIYALSKFFSNNSTKRIDSWVFKYKYSIHIYFWQRTKSTVLWSYFLSNIHSCKHSSNCSEFLYYANFIYFSSLLWNSWQSSSRTSDVAFSKNVEKQLPIQCPSPRTIFILKKASLFATKLSCSLDYKS